MRSVLVLTDHFDAGTLPKYEQVWLVDTLLLTDDEIAALNEYMTGGGVVIAKKNAPRRARAFRPSDLRVTSDRA